MIKNGYKHHTLSKIKEKKQMLALSLVTLLVAAIALYISYKIQSSATPSLILDTE